MNKKLRLLITKDCPRSCPGCCNKGFDLDAIPVVEHFNYDLIMITGGEPFGKARSKTEALLNYLKRVDINTNRKVIVYTASTDYVLIYFGLKYKLIDGITLTLHTQHDADQFSTSSYVKEFEKHGTMLRLNIFKGIKLPENYDLNGWKVKDNMEWIENCPVPTDEDFKRTKTI